MNDERTNGSLRACEHDATCHAPAIRRVSVLRPGWKVAEPRLYCFEHAAQVLPADAPATPVTAYDAPVRRPLRAEVLAALRVEPRHLSVIREALTRPALPMTVRRELDALIEEGLAVEGPPSHFARQEAAVKPKTKTPHSALTQHERVLEDVRAHPWTSVGDIMRRTEDGAASARLTQAVQAGEIVRIGEKRSYRYAMPGTPIPGLVEVAPVEAEESPEWGVADAPGEGFGRPMTLAERLAQAVGVDLVGGDVAIVEAVERIVAERDAAKARADRLDAMGSDLIADFLGGLRSALDVPAGNWSAAELITMVDAFRSEVVEELDRAGAAPGPTLDRLTAVVDELIQARVVPTKSPDTQALVTLRNAIENALDLAGSCSDEEVVEAARDAERRSGWWGKLRTELERVLGVEPGALDDGELVEAVHDRRSSLGAEIGALLDQYGFYVGSSPKGDDVANRVLVALDLLARLQRENGPHRVLATANASLREIGGGIAKRRVGCTVALESGSAFFPLSDEAALSLAPLLFRGVTVALLAPAPAPVRVAPAEPAAHPVVMPAIETPDDDMPF